MTKLDWQKVQDANSEHAFEAKTGRFVLCVRFTGSDTPWDAWLYAEGHREDDREASTKRVPLGWSINHIGQRFACMAAEKMLDAYVAPFVATARAEAALAEREACAEVIARMIEQRGRVAQASADPWFYEAQSAVLGLTERDIRARTTPATLSTETLAAIAEARGLRVVEPELLAGLDATALATAERERDEARAELARERADLAALTARMEVEIPAAAEAVRARAIAECVAFAVATEVGLMARGEVGRMHVGAHDVVLALRSLAVTQPASEDAGPSWAWDESLGCFAVRFNVVELRAYPDGRWWIWESEQSRLDGMAGNVREAMLAAVARERQDTRHRSDVSPEVHAALARLEAQLVPLVARAALSQPAPTDPADVDPAAGALR